jgi:methyl-accepting chemotaxis protein
VGSIRRVSDFVAEITAASAEQSHGVQQVGAAVAKMDRATQQNAALVEESAAAAESLRGQARQLVDVVAVFKLSH